MQAWGKLEINLSLIHFILHMVKNTDTCRMSQMGFRTFPDVRITKIHAHK